MRMLEQHVEKARSIDSVELRLDCRPLRIVIAGGTGHVGSMLARYFYSQGHSVVVLARTTSWRP